MHFPSPLIAARLIQRYKRFLADIDVNGTVVTAHVANPGAMLGNKEPGARVYVSKASNPKRKLGWDWQLIAHGDALVSVNTNLPNKMIAEALTARRISALSDYGTITPEVKYGDGSRIDFLLTQNGLPACYVEVKGVSMSRKAGLGEFPDSVTARGAKHMRALTAMRAAGHRAVVIYMMQRNDCSAFRVASDIDPAYAQATEQARAAGVEFIALGAAITLTEIAAIDPIKILA